RKFAPTKLHERTLQPVVLRIAAKRHVPVRSAIQMAVINGDQGFARASVAQKELSRNGADGVFAEENLILGRCAAGASRAEVLLRLVQLVESHASGMLCSILLVDESGLRLRHGAAPSLPESYVKAIDGVPIGPKGGSCGTAAYLKETVVVTDISKDPLWDDFREPAKEHGLRACWSSPIVHTGRVLGTFAMYYRVPRGPLPEERRLLDIAVRVASMAIQSSHTEQALRRSEERSLAILQAIPDSMFLLDSDYTYLECQLRASCQVPMDSVALVGKNMRDVLPAELAEKFSIAFQAASESQEMQFVEY